MKYLEFRIYDKDLAIEMIEDFIIEPTLINKIVPPTINTRHHDLVDGLINYRGRMVDVVDISPLYGFDKLRKFDGLAFIQNKDILFAIKYEGFHRISFKYDGEVIDLNDLIKKLTDFKS